jgi:hypothetical protein
MPVRSPQSAELTPAAGQQLISMQTNKHPWCGESQFFIYHTKWEAHVRMVR